MGQDVLLLSGPEPDAAWRAFGTLAGDLAVQLGVRMAVVLGAYPFATPHTRPSRLSCSSPSAELVADTNLLRNSVDVPAGMGAVLEHALHDARHPRARDLGAGAALPRHDDVVRCGGRAARRASAGSPGCRSTRARRAHEAIVQRQRIDQLIASNEEHRQMVRQMEAAYDQLGDARAAAGARPDDADPHRRRARRPSSSGSCATSATTPATRDGLRSVAAAHRTSCGCGCAESRQASADLGRRAR